jgi:peptide/nickel transport system permease protein
MTRLLIRWVLTAVPVVFAVSILTYFLESLIPGDAARSILGVNATPEQYEQLRRQLRLDDPLWSQYGHWLSGALHGDLGTSIASSDSVSHELLTRLPVTLWLVLGAVVVATVVGVALGVVSALRGGVAGRIVDAVSLLGLAVPGFWLGLVLITVFAVRIHLFPAGGYSSFADDPGLWLRSLVLPVLTLGFSSGAPIAKQTRDGVLAELGREYVTVLRARGVAEWRILLKHVLRNAGTPILSVIGIVTIGLFGGAVLAETVFVLPGLGGLVVSATAAHDLPIIQGVAVVFTLLVVAINLLVEIGYAALNPKVRQ